MQETTPFLWFDRRAEEAANCDASIFNLEAGRIGSSSPAGQLLLQLMEHPFRALSVLTSTAVNRQAAGSNPCPRANLFFLTTGLPVSTTRPVTPSPIG